MTQIDLGLDYETLCSSLRGYYLGREWYGALIMFDHARSYHSGQRKDGRPEFSHQIMQANYLRTVESGIIYREGTHITVLGHDLDEDHEVDVDETIGLIQQGVPLGWPGASQLPLVREALIKMNKYRSRDPLSAMRTGESLRYKLNSHDYHADIANDPIASIAKGLDRNHNVSTMRPPRFRLEKIESYHAETTEYVLPMLKVARKRFPGQEPVYQNLKTVMLEKMELVRELAILYERQQPKVEL